MADIITAIRESCRASVESSPHVSVNTDGIESFVRTVLFAQTPETLVPHFDLPLRFDSVDDEINLWTLLQLLNFGSGFRHELHDHVGAGAWDTMVRGVLSMHVMGIKVTADFLSNVAKADVTEYFGIQSDVEVQIMPAVYQHKPGPLAPLVDMIVFVMNDAGNMLRNRGHASFVELFRANKQVGRPKVAPFVKLLFDVFTGFRDQTVVRGKTVLVVKKAQLCAAYMHRKFKTSAPELFDFEDIERLTVMADNVVPAVLRATGILKLSDDLAAKIDARVDIAAGEIDTDLRAASVVACEAIVAKARELAASEALNASTTVPPATLHKLQHITEADIDEFLWTHGKSEGMRRLERHATKDTFYY